MILFPKEDEGTGRDERDSEEESRSEWLFEQQAGEDHGEYYAEFIDGGYARYVAYLYGLEVE